MKKSSAIIISILSVIVIGLCVFISYDKGLFKSKENDNKNTSNNDVKKDDTKTNTNTVKEIDINDDLIKNLVYPKINSEVYGGPGSFVLKEEYASSYDLGKKITASLDKHDEEVVSCYYNGQLVSGVKKDYYEERSCSKLSEEIINNDLKKMFGPDFKYHLDKSEDLGSTYCGYPKYYDIDTKAFYGIRGCGGAGINAIKPVLKTYKAELDGDNLYVYDYALINYMFGNPLEFKSLLFDNFESFKNYESTKSMDYVLKENVVKNDFTTDDADNAQEKAQIYLEELIKDKKARTYKWVFKKQSDGKYYYYSSNWVD